MENLLKIKRFELDKITDLTFDEIAEIIEIIKINYKKFDKFFRMSNKEMVDKKCESIHNNHERLKCFMIDLYNDISNETIKYKSKNMMFYIYKNIGIIGKKRI